MRVVDLRSYLAVLRNVQPDARTRIAVRQDNPIVYDMIVADAGVVRISADTELDRSSASVLLASCREIGRDCPDFG